MANINKSYRRVMAVGCSHGELANREVLDQILAFKDRYKPQLRFDLGDIVDTAAFRSGARGTPDEAKRPEPDEFSALRWMQDYAPNFISWGNHDWRLVELQASPNAIISYAASTLWNKLTDQARKLKARTVDYDLEHGWFSVGGTYWGHGYFYNEAALRDHAEYLGGPVVMAHLHRTIQENGRTRENSRSFCTGTLADVDSMKYARRRRATSRWQAGCVFGEVSDRSSHLWLVSAKKGEKLVFPL
jgi:hypothetical protein